MTRDVTVIIPTKNRAELLGITLGTVRAQVDAHPQVVIVDDGSDAAHAAAIQKFRDERTRVLRNEISRGGSAARNLGMQAAETRWVAFLDDDDLWTPTKLTAQLQALQRSGAAWVYSGAVKFEAGPILWQLMPPPRPDDVQERLAYACIVPAGASNVVADRETAIAVGGFDETLLHLADWNLWLGLLTAGTPAAAPDIAVAYRLHQGTTSLNPTGLLRELKIMDRRWRGLRQGRVLEAGPTHLWMAMSYLRTGNRSRAARSYLGALPTRPGAALRGMLRTLHPAAPRPAHVRLGEDPRTPMFKRVQHVVVPAEMEALLERHARVPKAPG